MGVASATVAPAGCRTKTSPCIDTLYVPSKYQSGCLSHSGQVEHGTTVVNPYVIMHGHSLCINESTNLFWPSLAWNYCGFAVSLWPHAQVQVPVSNMGSSQTSHDANQYIPPHDPLAQGHPSGEGFRGAALLTPPLPLSLYPTSQK